MPASRDAARAGSNSRPSRETVPRRIARSSRVKARLGALFGVACGEAGQGVIPIHSILRNECMARFEMGWMLKEGETRRGLIRILPWDQVAVMLATPNRVPSMKVLHRYSWMGLSFLFCIQTLGGWPELLSGRQNVPAPAGASGDTRVADVSPDGRFFLLISDAPNLVSPATLGGVDLYLHHRELGTSIAITAGWDGRGGDGATLSAFFARDGSRVIFESRARNLTSEAVSGLGDLFSYELATGETRLISVNGYGNAGGHGRSHGAVVTPDGRYVAFVSQAEDLVANDLNGVSDIFRRDLWEEDTRLVTMNEVGTRSATAFLRPPRDASHSPSLSEDGRYVAFTSVANLVVGNPSTGRPRQVYVRDMELETNILISVNVNGQPTLRADAHSPVIAGGRVYFLSTARDLTAEQLPASGALRAPDRGWSDHANQRAAGNGGTCYRRVSGCGGWRDGWLFVWRWFAVGAQRGPTVE